LPNDDVIDESTRRSVTRIAVKLLSGGISSAYAISLLTSLTSIHDDDINDVKYVLNQAKATPELAHDAEELLAKISQN